MKACYIRNPRAKRDKVKASYHRNPLAKRDKAKASYHRNPKANEITLKPVIIEIHRLKETNKMR